MEWRRAPWRRSAFAECELQTERHRSKIRSSRTFYKLSSTDLSSSSNDNCRLNVFQISHCTLYIVSRMCAVVDWSIDMSNKSYSYMYDHVMWRTDVEIIAAAAAASLKNPSSTTSRFRNLIGTATFRFWKLHAPNTHVAAFWIMKNS